MLFGKPDHFAIEAELQEVHGKWIFGRLRFWLGGNSIGDFDDTSDLATSARWGRTFLDASPLRTRAELDHMTAIEVYEFLYGRFVAAASTSPQEPLPGPWNRQPYVLDDVGESAVRDHFAVVVVRQENGWDRVLVKNFDEDRVSETLLRPGHCDLVIESYCVWVEGIHPQITS